MCVCSKSLCLTLCDPMDSVHGDSPGKNTGVGCPPSGDLPHPKIKLTSLMSPVLAGGFFTTSAIWETLLLFLMTVYKSAVIS